MFASKGDLKLRHHHYDPNQPRVPAGHDDGGQWTAGGGGKPRKVQIASRSLLDLLSAFKAPVRPPAPFPPSPPPPTAPNAPLPWTPGPPLLPSEPEQSPSPQPSGPTQLPDPLTGLLVAFAWWSARNSRDQRAIITLAREFHRAAPGGEFSYERVRLLNQDEVRRTCERLKDVQDITDKSVAAMKATRNGMSPTEYGTAVHATIAMTIGQSDPDFKAEISYEKMRQEGIKVPPPEAQQQGLNRPKQTHTESDYGIKGSIRVDVLERVKGTHTVCVYDIKTGRSGLSPRRMQEIAVNVLGAFPDTNHIIVTEVRPTDPWRPR